MMGKIGSGLLVAALLVTALIAAGGAFLMTGGSAVVGPCSLHDPNCGSVSASAGVASFCSLHDPNCNNPGP
jgi:hypothetical protein